MTKSKHNFKNSLSDLLEITIIGLGIFVLVYLFVGQLLEVTGESMLPTLQDKEQIIAEKISVKFKPLERGEIVVFKHPENQSKLLVKRVIAIPSDTIRISENTVYINGDPIEEPYLYEDRTLGKNVIMDNKEYKMKNNEYVLMGDNRQKSSDSRMLGPIKEDLIVGRVFLVYYPFENFRIL